MHYALVRICSRALNLIEPVPNFLQRYRFAGYEVCWVHYALVRKGSSTVNLIESSRTTSSQRWVEIKCSFTCIRGGYSTFSNLHSSGNRNSSMRFKHIKLHQTFLNYILTEIAKYIYFFHTSSEWFNWTTRDRGGLT